MVTFTFIRYESIGRSGALPMGCRNGNSKSEDPINGVYQASTTPYGGKLTVLPADRTRKVFFVFLTRIMIFILTAESEELVSPHQ